MSLRVPSSAHRALALALALPAPVGAAACRGDDAPAAEPKSQSDSGPKSQPKSGDEPGPDPSDLAAVQVDPDHVASCASCHAAIVDEWNQSMHARAHHDADPIYGAMRRLRMAKQGDAIAGKCAQCHNPRDPSAPDSPAGKAGVSCAACHNLVDVHAGSDRQPGAVGAKALVFAEDSRMIGPHDPVVDPMVHGRGPAAPFITDGQTLCLACHDTTHNPAGVAACTTGTEYAARADAARSCTSCHMPRVAGAATAVPGRTDHASHAFLGPHRAWDQDDPAFLAQGVELAATLTDTLEVTLRNRSGHGFPSAFPGRVATLVAVGIDDHGEAVWRNFAADPMQESPQSVLGKVYVDATGKPVMPPFATELKRDSRLTPDERRVVTFEVPADVVRVDVELHFRLVPGPAVEALGLSETPLAEPRVVTKVTATRA